MSDPRARKVSELVSALLEGADPGLDRAALERARAIIEAVGHALRSGDEGAWRRLDQAWEILCRTAPADSPNVDATAAFDARSLSVDDALPFSAGHATPPPSAAAELPPRSGSDLDGTAVGALRLDLDALPFDRPAGKQPELSLEQYASLCAEVRRAPQRASEIARRYGVLSPEAGQALGDAWRKRFAADDALRGRYEQLLSHYAAWLASQRPT